MAICKADVDQDGDMDLFVGGKLVPHQYPKSPDSRLLINEAGKLIDKSKTLAPMLEGLGMVTDACFTDHDNDGDQDLVVVGEWMPVTILENNNGQFSVIQNQNDLSNHNLSLIHI